MFEQFSSKYNKHFRLCIKWLHLKKVIRKYMIAARKLVVTVVNVIGPKTNKRLSGKFSNCFGI